MSGAIFNEGKLEELLVANWAHFMDSRELLAYAKLAVQDRASELAIINGSMISVQPTRLTISRFCPSWPGLVLWADVSMPCAGGYAEATVEAAIGQDGRLTTRHVAGVLHLP